MNLAEARALVADTSFKAAVETATSLPLRDSEDYDAQVFTLVRDAGARFKEIYTSHGEGGWELVVGNQTRGFAVFERGDDIFALNLDKKRSPKRGIDASAFNDES